ncbi:hypothetical protein SG34_000155 [Thalassomonas viridans]|uniref:Uncharacterized protein n=1 Tax=Thalassomonas viridans TaxID=137584 RepID=A0AAF0C9M3_9GAMM|nr:hypothetical protein [Thalassomonas viridans]WDE05400.1 hypothetical protein SG34_000155 [Thalassomonas viridans]
MNKVLSRLMMAGTCMAMSLTASAVEQACSASVQLTNYTPGICYYDFDQQTCTDTCATADPQFQSACFAEIDLPCGLKEDLFANAAGHQQRDQYDWVHISDLLSYPALQSELHVLQQELYQTLYEDYLTFPAKIVFSEASQELKKQNFRFDMIDASKAITTPLNDSGLYRRLSLGQALEGEVQTELDTLHEKISQFPLFSQTEKTNLSNELNTLKNSQLMFWNFISRYPTASVAASRVSLLNSKLLNYVNGLNELSPEKFTYMFNKSALLTQSHDINLRLCQPDGFQACYDAIANNDPAGFYLGKDQRLTYFEEALTLLAQEVEALKLSFDPDLNPGTPGAFTAPDFTGFINEQLTAYSSNPGLDTLNKLESAINIAFLQQGNTGLELFEQIKQSTASHIQGRAFLAPVEYKNPLLCSDFNNLDPQIQQIQEELAAKVAEGDAIFEKMNQNGYSNELLAQLEAIVDRILELERMSSRLFSVDRFTDDRKINVLWRLGDSQEVFNSASDQVTVEFVALDGMFWMPSMSIQLQQLMPSIESVSTMQGSLLPAADGRISGMRSLNLSLRQSPYAACSPANSELKMVVSTTNAAGVKTRHALTATLNEL